jgi:hypothetical protein
MAIPTIMPPQGHSAAPQLTPNVPRQLQQYFKDLELLFIPAPIVSDIKRKIQACHYVNIPIVDLWE